jgi:hypothetical protein
VAHSSNFSTPDAGLYSIVVDMDYEGDCNIRSSDSNLLDVLVRTLFNMLTGLSVLSLRGRTLDNIRGSVLMLDVPRCCSPMSCSG